MKKIKKTMAYVFALICCFSAVTTFSGNYIQNSVVANAEEEKTFECWSYVVHNKMDGVCNTPCVEITKFIYQDDLEEVRIPEKINGLPVVSIAGDTFKEDYPDRIYLPSSIKHFGEDFIKNLRAYSVIVDDKFEFLVNFVGKYSDVFNLNYDKITPDGFRLTYVYPPDDKELIEDIEIPETVCGLTVTEIGGAAFANNQNIRAVKIPDTVRYLETMVFADSSVEKVNIPKALRILPGYTFQNCSNLKSVEFHENLVVEYGAFKNTNIEVPDNIVHSLSTDGYHVTLYCDDNKQYTATVQYNKPDYLMNNPDIIVPDFVLSDIPVTSIQIDWHSMYAQDSDINLNSITFPSTITTISNIRNLSIYYDIQLRIKKLIVNGGNVSIEQGAFKDSDIEEIVISDSCAIKPNAFSDCKNLKKVEFTGDSPVIDIKNDAFKGCTSLEKIIFPDNITADIGVDAFRNCTSLKELTLNGKIDITSHAFRECDGLQNIILNGDITLDTYAFSDCSNLTNITIDTNKSITGSAFNGCSNLVNINSSPVYNLSAKKFYPEINDFVFNNFNGADDVGFINSYVLEQVDNVIEKYITDDMSDMQKIKTIHDWICNNTVYDFEQTYSEKNHNDASIFMNASSVCEGYAKCYNLLLNRAGIETYYLVGKEHAWNIIKLGGHYFHSDTTWDDGDNINYDWFLKSDSEALSEDMHSRWTLSTPSTLHSFQKETLPECKYSMGDLNTDGEINVADLVTLNKYLMGQSTLSEDDIVLADLTYDGVTDVFDLVLMRKLLLNK